MTQRIRKISTSGFTLVELLVVILIIMVISFLGFKSYDTFLKKSRDEQRFSDFNRIQHALEQFYTIHGTYPCGDEPYEASICSGTVEPTCVDPAAAPAPNFGSFSDSWSNPFVGDICTSGVDPMQPVSRSNPLSCYAGNHWDWHWDSCPGLPQGGLYVNGFLETPTIKDPLNKPFFVGGYSLNLAESNVYLYVVSYDRKSYILYANLEYYTSRELNSYDGGLRDYYYEIGPGVGKIPPRPDTLGF